MKTHYQHIIWDWNGTLLNDAWLCIEVLNGLLAKRGRNTIGEHTYRQHFGFPVIHFYEFLGFDFSADNFDCISREFIDSYESRWLEECALHPESVETLTALSTLGISHSILSAAEQSALEIGIQHYALSAHFTKLVGADNIYANGKIERGRQSMETLHLDPRRVLLIGDTLHDHEVAQAIGCDSLLLAHGHHSPDRLNQSGAPVVNNHRELLDYFY